MWGELFDMSNKLEYRPLTIPKVQWNKKNLTETYGELVAQPLEPGFGITLGNALRRILLGSIEGSAITAVVIKGVNNEFASIPNVVEDVMQILLNIKGIVIKNSTGQSGSMTLQFKGQGIAKAGDIQLDSHLAIVNPDHIIAHVSAGGELDISFTVQSGRGYQPAQWPAGQGIQEDSQIYLDAMFSPVSKVFFDVEKTMVGKDIDYDKLTLKIHTNGAEISTDVLNYSVSVLRSQLEHFLVSTEIPFNTFSEVVEETPVVVEDEAPGLGLDAAATVDILLKPIDELELSARAHNCLINAGKKRILDLVNLSRDEALNLKNFGSKSLNEVEDSLKSLGLSFGANIKETDIKKILKVKSDED